MEERKRLVREAEERERLRDLRQRQRQVETQNTTQRRQHDGRRSITAASTHFAGSSKYS